jgi:hypothetical protein
MANKSLIEGELYAITGGNKQGGFTGVDNQTFQDIENMSRSLEQKNIRRQQEIAKKESKIQSINNQIGNYLNQIKSDFDISGLTPEQHNSVASWLDGKKQEYIDAANEIVNYSPSDPEYMQYKDAMNSINREFVAAANNLKTYKDSQVGFYNEFDEGRISNGDLKALNQAKEIYSPEANFSINGGALVFNVDGDEIEFSKFKNPSSKAFAAAGTIMDMAEQYHKSGRQMDQYAEANLRLKLEDILSKEPGVLKSLANDKLFNSKIMNIDPILTDSDEYGAELREKVTDEIVRALKEAADLGYKAKQSKINQVGSSSTGPRTHTFTSTESPFGRAGKVEYYMPKDGKGKIKYVDIATGEEVYVPIGGNKANTTTTTTTTTTPSVNEPKVNTTFSSLQLPETMSATDALETDYTFNK